MPDAPRTIVSFSTDWKFCLGDVDGGEGVSLDHDGWEAIHLPHTWNDKDTFVSPRGYYRGRGWYRKRFDVADKWTGRRLSLEFDAAFAVADVWINGVHLGQFMGGFTGFTTDITDAVRPGGNLIAIKLSNEHDPDVLPGREIPDYDLYGGIYRGSRLVIKNDLYIPQHGITVTTPEASDAKGSVRVALDVCNMSAAESDCTCTAILRGPGGGEVGTLTDVGESPFAPTWAPDGRSIAYSCYVHPGAETYVRDLRTRARRRLTNTSARSGHAAWSPDGNRIAFVSRPGGRGDIYTVSPDGTDMRRVTRDVGTVRFPAWFRWREDRVLSHDPRNRADMDRERRRTGRIRCGAVGRRWRLRPDMVAGRTMDRVQPTGSKRREPVRDLCRRRSGRPSDGQRLSRRVPVVVAGRP